MLASSGAHIPWAALLHGHHHKQTNDRYSLTKACRTWTVEIIGWNTEHLINGSDSTYLNINLCKIEWVWKVISQSRFLSFWLINVAPSTFLYSCLKNVFLHSWCMWSENRRTAHKEKENEAGLTTMNVLKYLQKATTLTVRVVAYKTNSPVFQLFSIPDQLTVRVQLTANVRNWYEKYPNEEKEFTARRKGWWWKRYRCAMTTAPRWGWWHHCWKWSGLWLRNYFRSRMRILSSDSFARNFRLLNILWIEFSLLLTVYTDMISSSFLSSLIKFSFIPSLPHIQSSAMISIIGAILCCCFCCLSYVAA